jgi:hypothetical protein
MKNYLLVVLSSFCFSSSSFSKENVNYEIKTAPIAFFASWLTLDFSINLNDQWALGPSVIIYQSAKTGNMFAPSYNGFAGGAHFYYYFNSFSENGWYWGNHVYYENYESYPHNFLGHYGYTGFKINSKVGYQLVSTSNINFYLGAGAEARNYAQKNTDDSSQGQSPPTFSEYVPVIPYIEFKVGYKF